MRRYVPKTLYIVLAFLLAVNILLAMGCGSGSRESTAEVTVTMQTVTDSPLTPSPVVDTPQAVVDVMISAETKEPGFTPIPTPSPTPTPVPTDTPAPTEIPFSYYAPTVNMTFEELVGSLGDLDPAHPKDETNFIVPVNYPAPDTYRIIIDTYWQVVLVYTKDENGEYTVPVRYMLCSSGSSRVGGETRLGEWKIEPDKERFGQFKVTREFAQYWTRIRSRTYFHSILYSTSDLNSYQISVYNNLGTKASHGCVRLTVPDARWIYYNICYGTICIVREGSKDDLETKAIREQLVLPPVPPVAAKIVAGLGPYTDNWKIEDIVGDPAYPYVYATHPPVPKS